MPIFMGVGDGIAWARILEENRAGNSEIPAIANSVWLTNFLREREKRLFLCISCSFFYTLIPR
ncbi:MAG TPA: hypothetical protein DCS89_16590 [Gammaproteobacteria bacterium]|nr:hypothetical protein [Gammaproteobacteria bacterium]